MSDYTYTDEQLEEAMAYVRSRIENENSMIVDVERLLEEFAVILISLIMRGASKEEIDEAIESLIDELYEDSILLAIDEHEENRDMILSFITRPYGDDNIGLKDRITSRVYTYLNELMAIVAAGKILSMMESQIVQSYITNMETPYRNPVITKARQMVESGEAVSEYPLDEPHFGQGVPISSEKALQDMTVYAVGEAWMYNDWMNAKRNGAIGFIPKRGSSYPCELCDSHAEKFHEMGEEMPLYHNHCKCYIVWIYLK